MNKIYQKSFFGGKNAGFTLIELLVVVLIIGILAAVALPQYTKAVEKSRAAQALTTLKSMSQAYQAYYMANGDYPTSFEQLDLDMEWTGNEKWYSMAADTRSNGDWSLQIVNEPGYKGVYIGRLTGEYKGGGFGFLPENPVGLDTGSIFCGERTYSGIVLEKDANSYCGKLFNATFTKTAGGTRAYQLK